MIKVPDKSWKRFERDIASIFGTTRRLMKGTDEVSDIGNEHFPLILDCKLRKSNSWQVIKWFLKMEQAARYQMLQDSTDENVVTKWPVLVLREPGKKRKYAVVRWPAIQAYITHRCSFVSEDFYVVNGGEGKRFSFISEWDRFIKEVNKKRLEGKIKPDVIPILTYNDQKHGAFICIMKPEDLARIFQNGGLIDAKE